MAIAALGSERAFMDVFTAMAADARRVRFTICLTALMTGFASEARVRALERKVGLLVVEALARKFGDVRPATLVLGVASRALRLISVQHVAVEAAASRHVFADDLVTSDAQLRHARAVAAIVAIRAGLFQLGVRRTYLPRHQQRFDSRGSGVARLHST